MKKAAKWIVAALAACTIAFTGCKIVSEPESVAVESITLSETTLSLAPGDTMKLTATVKPDNADDKSVKWSSSNTAVAMVSSDGKVVAIETGTATITAQAGGKTAICVITVKEAVAANPDSPIVNPDTPVVNPDLPVVNPNTPVVNPDSPVAVESVTLSATMLTIEPGKTRTLTATVTPNNADDKAVTWSSSNMSVATVNEDGIVTAHTEGTVTITVKAGGKEATCTVAVKPILIAVKSVTLNMTTLTFTRGESGKLSATVMPDNADDTTVAWVSSNSDVAIVGNDGTVTAVKTGTATITAQAGDITAECTVIVNPILIESVTLDKTTLTLAPGMTGKLTATVNPENADDKTVKWSSSNTSVAMVDNDGTVGAINTGKTTITAQAGDKKATCVVTVHTDHSYSGGKCTLCGARPYLDGGEIYADGVLRYYYGKEANVVIPDGVTKIGYNAFTNYTKLENVIIPDSVTGIESNAFAGCRSLTSVTIPASVSFIGTKAFYFCTSLASVVISEGVTRIADYAFSECTSLTSVTIPGSVKRIGDSFYSSTGVFRNCSNLTNVTILEGVENIGGGAFMGCTSLTNVTIPDSVTSIEGTAFYGCRSLTNVTIPDSVKTIESGAFQDCNLILVKYGGTLLQWCAMDNDDSITSVENITLNDVENLNTLEKLVIPGGVTSIGIHAFSNCLSLTNVEIPDSVTAIGNHAFAGCKKLTSVTIPRSVANIGFYAFSSTDNFISVTYGGTEVEWEKIERFKSASLNNAYADGLSGKTIIGSDGSTWTAE